MGKTTVKSGSLRTALNQVAGITNDQFWDKARRFDPTFKSHTAEATAELFTDKGFEQITLAGTQTLNEFFEVSMRVAFQLLNVARAKNPLVDKGLVQVFNEGMGGYIQRMSVETIKPVSPAYLNIQNGDWVNQDIVRKAEVKERFFARQFAYQSLITIQDYQLKKLWLNPTGMGQYIAGVMQGLANGYTIQEYVNIKECINTALNSDVTPLQDTQKIEVSNYAETDEGLIAFILSVKNLATQMETTPSTAAYNAMGFDSSADVSDHVLLIRSGIKNLIDVKTLVGAFNPEKLSIPFEMIEISDFGGLVPKDAENATMTPAYDTFGSEVGFVTGTPDAAAYKKADGKYYVRIDGTETEVSEKPDHYEDPNANCLGVVMQKGAIFEDNQNPYTVNVHQNFRGLYTNYIANKPEGSINYDALYNVIAFTKPNA